MTDVVDVPAVRVGTLEDLDGMMHLALNATEENAFASPDVSKLLGAMWGALTRQNGIVGIIGKPGETFQGAILLVFGELWYSREPVLEERAVFVAPEYRSAKGGRARKLCEFAKTASEELGIPLTIGVLSNNRTEAKIRLYERMFGQPAGVYFLYGAKTGLGEPSSEIP
jgi:GNAT superfamily N-acetyltransferase